MIHPQHAMWQWILILAAWFGTTTPASAVEVSGNFTSFVIHTRDTQHATGITSFSRARLAIDQQTAAWRAHIAYDNELLWGALARDPQLTAASLRPDPTWLNASATIHQSPANRWRHTLYRGWLRWEKPSLRITVGRQRIAWGSGRLWNPTDRFNPLQPTALEPAQKLGVDAFNLQWNHDSNSIELVLAPGNIHRTTSRKSALRWQSTIGETDIAAMVARIGGEKVVGLDISSNLGAIAGRIEWMHSQGGQQGRFSQLVTGIDGTWMAAPVPNGLYLAVEYFYNGGNSLIAANNNDLLQSYSPQLIGFSTGYDLTPLWRLETMLLADIAQGGLFISPRLTWSIMENMDMTAIGQWPDHRAGNAFATLNNLFALQVEWYL